MAKRTRDLPSQDALLAKEFAPETWKDRKSRWQKAYPKGVSEIEERAMDDAKPGGDPDRIEHWRKEFGRRVKLLKSIQSTIPSTPQSTPAETRNRLRQAARSLARATKALAAVPEGYVSQATRDEVVRLGETVNLLADGVVVKRDGNRHAPVKGLAAKFAFDLLDYYVRLPTVTNDGDYISLACTLYEAATGRAIASESIAHQCREHVAWMRKVVGSPDAFRTRRKRTGRF